MGFLEPVMSEQVKKKPLANPKTPSRGHDFDIINIGDYLGMIRERWFFGLICAVLFSGLVGYFLLSQPPVYQARSGLLWEQGERVLDIPQVVDTGLEGAGGMWTVRLQNHINEIYSNAFRAYVVESFTEEEAQTIVSPYVPEDPSEPMPSVMGSLGEIRVSNVPGSFMVTIQVRHGDPEAAALIANRYAERYIEFARDRREVGNVDVITFLEERAEEFRRRVSEAEQEMQDYRSERNLVSLEENQDLVAQRLNNIHANLMGARVERTDLQRELDQIERLRGNEENLAELGDLLTTGSVGSHLDRLDALRQEREVMSERYLERHPRMVENQREIEATRRLIRDNIDRAVTELRNRLDRAREREARLVAELEEAEQESIELDRMRIEYAGLRMAVESARQSHVQILNRLNETAITSRMENANMRIVDYAHPARSPVEPDPTRIAIIVFFLAGFFFVGTPIGMGVIDQKLKASMDIEKFLGTTLVSELPRAARIKEKDRAHIVEKGLDDRTSETFRGIVSHLVLNWDNSFPKAVIATSTVPREGKSFFVSNLGFCFSAHGKKTLLVDCDFRRPSLHQIYGLPNDAGVLRWLHEGGMIREDVMEDGALGIIEVAPDLFLLRAGGATKKATEAISNTATGRLMTQLKEKFDFLMIDTPPMGIFTDALALSNLADHSLYVVRFGKVDRRQVKSVVSRLQESDSGFMGVVINDMPNSRRFVHYRSDYGCRNYKYEKYYAGKA